MSELLHDRCHATYFDRCDEMGVAPMEEVATYTQPQRADLDLSNTFGARIYRDSAGGTVALWWTDFVANDWCEEVGSVAEGFRLLADLIEAVDEDRELVRTYAH